MAQTGTTTFHDTVEVTTVAATTVNATTITGAANAGTLSHALPGTTLTAAGTFAPTFANGYIQMNAAAGTNLAFVLTTTGLKTGGVYHLINRTAPTSGTYTLTASAGTFYQGAATGTAAQFAGGNYAITVLVLSSTVFQVLSNVGTVSYA